MRTLTHHFLHSFLASWDTLTQTKAQLKHGFKQRPDLICSLENNGGFANGSIVQGKERLFAAAEGFFFHSGSLAGVPRQMGTCSLAGLSSGGLFALPFPVLEEAAVHT